MIWTAGFRTAVISWLISLGNDLAGAPATGRPGLWPSAAAIRHHCGGFVVAGDPRLTALKQSPAVRVSHGCHPARGR